MDNKNTKRVSVAIELNNYKNMKELADLSGKSVAMLLSELLAGSSAQIITTLEMFKLAKNGEKKAFEKLAEYTERGVNQTLSHQTDLHDIINEEKRRKNTRK